MSYNLKGIIEKFGGATEVYSKNCLEDSKFQNKTDEEIVIEAKNNNSLAQEFIISKYENFVKAKAKSYFLIGADKEDIYQEGMIALYKPIIPS